MKKVSAKLFFTVMWRGVCQALEWFFGLFGFKRDGKMANIVWGLFSTSAAVIMAIIAAFIVYGVGSDLWDWYDDNFHNCEETWCYENHLVCGDIYFHRQEGHFKGYVYNAKTHEKLVKNVASLEEPLGNDSLVAFSDGEKYGFFSKITGKIIVAPKYECANMFSDGRACVAEDGRVKFIDGTGKVVIDTDMTFKLGYFSFVYLGGYCKVITNDGEYYGLMDRTGKLVLPKEYSSIENSEDHTLWSVRKDDKSAVLDKEMNYLIPPIECEYVEFDDRMIYVMMNDHTLRCYDRKGKLLNDFCIRGFALLEYETEELVTHTTKPDEESDPSYEPIIETYHRKGTARLRSYQTGAGYEGLMTAEGHAMTLPIYEDIRAIGPDTYLCTLSGDVEVVVNGKGEVVR